MQSSHYSPTQTLPQVQPHYGTAAISTPAPSMMLPPLRMPNHNDPRVNLPYASSAPAPLSVNHFGYSYTGINQFSTYQRSPAYLSSGYIPHHSTSSSTGSEIWTPMSATSSGGYPMYNNNNTSTSSNGSTPNFGAAPPPASQPPTPGTIQPSAFPNWQPTSDLRSKNLQGTISPLGFFGPGYNNSGSQGGSRLMDRRSSTPATTWERPDMSGKSPSLSDRSEDDSHSKSGSTAIKNGNQNENDANDDDESEQSEKPILVTYTTDAEVKQTPEIKRQCFNCTNKSPPSWRKSLLHPGKILCNKCGIFERTHHKPRPPQNDDQKLRKHTPLPGMAAGYGMRDIPPQLQAMRDDSDGSPVPPSPYSNAPAQATPVSATFSFPQQSYHSPSDSLLSSSGYRRALGGMWNQTSPSSLSPNTPATSTFDGDYSSPIRTGYHSQGHGSSPYAHAYANRRTYTQHPIRNAISPIQPSYASPFMTTTTNQIGNNNSFSPAFGASSMGFNWNSTRRHSDINLSTSSIGEIKSGGEDDDNEPLNSIKTELQ
ncbi:uncharacterized protein I206_104414 [Kwoniella pini CBS 10737]|uniref:GATA-type domain-containing protein n=1 Tax=Kwoniella pini CBS 10737 TaxID=1296096 RepID=A0A1B9I1R2_9TREE|nr:uncharacterized protein I206_04004 [Kwoniella pini CBS 10737]OCF49483.1 hypothetical protein I206_04004 [Kwoniella pini CBS 10737]